MVSKLEQLAAKVGDGCCGLERHGCGLRMVSKILSRGGREEDSVLQKCEMETMESIDMRRGLTTMF
jgi:hypothetical protein